MFANQALSMVPVPIQTSTASDGTTTRFGVKDSREASFAVMMLHIIKELSIPFAGAALGALYSGTPENSTMLQASAMLFTLASVLSSSTINTLGATSPRLVYHAIIPTLFFVVGMVLLHLPALWIPSSDMLLKIVINVCALVIAAVSLGIQLLR